MPRPKTNQLRIISGTHGGRLFDAPKTSATQPMGDRERLAIFNFLRPYLSEAHVLDAFAGSGALGMEALSNGAADAAFFETHPDAIKTIQSNLAKLKFNQNTFILRKSPPSSIKYDLIFADPPYDKPQYALIDRLKNNLKAGGFLILSHPANPRPPEFIGLSLLSNKRYAAANIKTYQKI